MSPAFRIEPSAPGDRRTVRTVLDDLPAWFGRPESTQEYVEAADRLPGFVALAADGEPVGVVLVEQHFPESAEVHVMGVVARWHRRGVGRALLAAVEADLRTRGVRMLMVKTLGASDPDEGYRRTRLFYERMGFVPLEELTDLWPGTACLLMAKPLDLPAR